MKTHILISFFCILLFLLSCGNEEDDGIDPDSNLVSFDTLYAQNDTLDIGDSTTIYAVATGEKLQYSWNTNSNTSLITIPGSASSILYYADPCVGTGTSLVFCTITAKNREETKQVEIFVK
jgi:hypothetical protein